MAHDDYLEWQYDLRARHPNHNQVKATSHLRSEGVRSRLPVLYNLPCGSGPNARFDMIPGRNTSEYQPVMVFIHGGFWRSGDKSEVAFLAEPFHQHGITTVLLNYSLAPTVGLREIICELRDSLADISRQARLLGLDPDAMVVGGHSAGGHLAAMMAVTDWTKLDHLHLTIKASFGLSGLYDPSPLARTSFQSVLALPDNCTDLVARPTGINRQALDLVACGSLESKELKAQSQRYAKAVLAKQGIDPMFWVKDRDHYDILHELGDADSLLFRRVLDLF